MARVEVVRDAISRIMGKYSRHHAGTRRMTGDRSGMAETLYLKQLECGPMQNYVYLIGDPATRQAACACVVS